MRAIAGSILILAAVQFHQSPVARLPLGMCLLALLVVTGVGCLISDLAKPAQSRLVQILLQRVLDSGNFLIKGTVVGALLGLLMNFAVLGATRVGNLTAIPCAAIGLIIGVAIDAVAHRRKHRHPSESSESDNPWAADEPRLPEHRPTSLIEARGWDLSSGKLQQSPDWPGTSDSVRPK